MEITEFKKIYILYAIGASMIVYFIVSLFTGPSIEQINKEEQDRLQIKLDMLEPIISEGEKAKVESDRLKECLTQLKSNTGSAFICEENGILPKAQAAEPPKEVKAQPQNTWLVNKDGQSKSKEELGGETFEAISVANGIPTDYWYQAEKKYKVKKEVALCIAWADSGLGKHLKTRNNIGNVGNNDRGDRVHYTTLEKGVEAIFRVLNNQHLGHKQSIGSLSVGGGGDAPYYATSPDNWDKNTRNCLSVIHGQPISKDFKIRL